MTEYPYRLIIKRADGTETFVAGDNLEEMTHIGTFLMTDPERYRGAYVVDNK